MLTTRSLQVTPISDTSHPASPVPAPIDATSSDSATSADPATTPEAPVRRLRFNLARRAAEALLAAGSDVPA